MLSPYILAADLVRREPGALPYEIILGPEAEGVG